MDAFFASVELLRQPQLRGLPLVIGGARRAPGWLGDAALESLPPAQIPPHTFARLKDYTGRGVITTATYEARQFGVGSAMGLMKAARLCPQAILLPTDFDEYRRYSRLFKSAVREIVPIVEDRGIDEIYLDLTSLPGAHDDGGLALAQAIQQRVAQATGLTCSIGVAPNKMLAKMASEFNKPNGISIVQPHDLASLIWPLACRKINGIGPKTDTKLQALGIYTIGELARQPLEWLQQHFGQAYGAWMYASARGQDNRPLETQSEPVSISRETTFERDMHAMHDRQELGRIFSWLCERVADDLHRKGYVGRTIGIKLKYHNFKTATRAQSLDYYTADPAHIRQAAAQCLKRVDLSQRFRLLGVKVDSLLKTSEAAPAPTSSHRASATRQLAFDFG